MMRRPEGSVAISDLEEADIPPLGSLTEVRRKLQAALPEIDLADPAWGTLEGDDYSIEFSVGEEDPCMSVMLHVRGGDEALGVIQRLFAATGWEALDTTPPKGVRIGGVGFDGYGRKPKPWWKFW